MTSVTDLCELLKKKKKLLVSSTGDSKSFVNFKVWTLRENIVLRAVYHKVKYFMCIYRYIVISTRRSILEPNPAATATTTMIISSWVKNVHRVKKKYTHKQYTCRVLTSRAGTVRIINEAFEKKNPFITVTDILNNTCVLYAVSLRTRQEEASGYDVIIMTGTIITYGAIVFRLHGVYSRRVYVCRTLCDIRQ